MHGRRRRKSSPLNFVDAELEPTIEKTVVSTPPTTSTALEAETEGANKMQDVNSSNSESKGKMRGRGGNKETIKNEPAARNWLQRTFGAQWESLPSLNKSENHFMKNKI